MTETLTGAKLYVEHQPESHRSVNSDSTVTEAELPGFVEVGVEVNGARIKLARIKAGGFLADVERAKASKSDSSKSNTPKG